MKVTAYCLFLTAPPPSFTPPTTLLSGSGRTSQVHPSRHDLLPGDRDNLTYRRSDRHALPESILAAGPEVTTARSFRPPRAALGQACGHLDNNGRAVKPADGNRV